jgi:hypothetical protein
VQRERPQEEPQASRYASLPSLLTGIGELVSLPCLGADLYAVLMWIVKVKISKKTIFQRTFKEHRLGVTVSPTKTGHSSIVTLTTSIPSGSFSIEQEPAELEAT